MRHIEIFDADWQVHVGELDPPIPRNAAKVGTIGQATDLTVAEGASPPPLPPGMAAVLGSEAIAHLLGTAAELGPGWRRVDLPDDWTTREDAVAPAVTTRAVMGDPALSGGYLPTGVAWYRKVFDVPAAWDGQRVSIEFDGAMREARVYVNGSFVGAHYSGYVGFALDVSEYLRYGDEGRNVVLVRTDTSSTEGWWAEGAGIYRHVRLVVTGPVHIARHGVFVHTAHLDSAGARLHIATDIDHDGDGEVGDATVTHVVDGTVVETSAPMRLAGPGRSVVTNEIRLVDPARWSPASPALHELRTTLRVGDVDVDELTTLFGVRTIEYTRDGLLLNGERTPIRGACVHQDFAGVGIALPDRVHEHKVAKLRDVGCNAYRSAHHAPAPEILDACDRLGLLVLDENRRLETNAEGLADLEELIRRDRNHPSVFMWCLENEELIAPTAMARRLLRRLVAVANRLDPTRPTTVAGQFAKADPAYMSIPQVAGFNYDSGDAARLREERPDVLVMATEDASFISSRGEYDDQPDRGLCSSLDTGGFLERMARARAGDVDAGTVGGMFGEHGRLTSTWSHMHEHPYLGGAFVWSGFDYRGEAVPYGWPAVNSAFGMMDLCGFPKDVYHYWRSRWSAEPVVHVLPHWNWPERIGDEIAVHVYTNADAVELLVNGESLGVTPVDGTGVLRTSVTYQPGRLDVRALRESEVVATTFRETTGPPSALALTTADDTCRADGRDVVLVHAAVVDAEGRVVPTADHELEFSASSGAAVLGTGNGSQADSSRAASAVRSAFNGLALAVVRGPHEPCEFRVSAVADGLASGEVVVSAVP